MLFHTTDYLNYDNAVSGYGVQQMLNTPSGIIAIGDTMLFNAVTPILKSTDNGANWSAQNISGIDDDRSNIGFGGVANLNGKYLLIRGVFYGSESNDFYTSIDASTWTTVDAPTGFIPRKIYATSRLVTGNNLFVLATGTSIFTSPDGINWSQRATVKRLA